VIAEPGSQASLVETFIGTAGELYFTNAVTEVVLGEGAVLDFSRLERESDAAFHISTIAVSQGRDSHFTSHSISLGGALARNDLNVRLDAEGAECTLNGLFLGSGSQLLDNHTLIDHAKPHGTSRELYKGIMDGKSRGIFHGTIIVRPDAQKTDAMQTNKNLLLSKEALVNSEPALEIFADDVKCRHGSTIGQLDAAAMFYLRSRGIGEAAARGLLTYAFASDLLGRIRHVGPLIAITRDGGEGRVRPTGAGGVRIDYRLDERGVATMRHALVSMARLARAAGARSMLAAGTPPRWHGREPLGPGHDDRAFLAFEDALRRFDFGPNRGAVFSAHQLGTVRMGADAADHACDPAGRVRAGPRPRDGVIGGLYVADGSLFPTGLGVNPQITIMALARRVARTVASDARTGTSQA